MKKCISIFFVSLYLMTNTQMSELLKLPMLVQHYMEHQQENEHLSLLEFLDIHYAQGNPHDGDYDKDMKLPFKSVENSVHGALTFCLPSSLPQPRPLVYFEAGQQHHAYYRFIYSSAFLAAIWQPPKFC